MGVVTKGKNEECKLSPLVGESVNRQVDERGKCEQIRKNDFNLCMPTCPYRLARLGTSLRVQGGSKRLRRKEFMAFKMSKTKNNGMAHAKKVSLLFACEREIANCKPSLDTGSKRTTCPIYKERMKNVSCPRLSGKVSTVRLTKGASVSRSERMEMSVRRNGRTEKNEWQKCGRRGKESLLWRTTFQYLW